MTVSKSNLAIQHNRFHFGFGSYLLQADGTLTRDSVVVPLPPKELAVLRLLLANAGEIVSSERLRREAWGQVNVSPDSLPRCLSSLRAHLHSGDCIQTVYKRGYRFALPVKVIDPNSPDELNGRLGPPGGVERRKNRLASSVRLAILPFAAGNGVPEYLGAGVAEETMLRLAKARIPIVELMARDSVFHLAARGTTASEVGHTLNADLVLCGTVLALPLHFRLRTEMIRVADSVQLWTEDFLLPRQLLAHADARVAKRIVARIRNTVAPSMTSLGSTAPETGPAFTQATTLKTHEEQRSQAYEIHLKARSQWNTLERQNMHDAIRGFQHALELDPGMLDPHLHLVHDYLSLSSHGYLHADVAAEQARKQAEIAFSLSPNAHTLYPALGWIHFHHDRNFAAAAEAFGRPQRSGYNPWSVTYEVRYALGQSRFAQAITLLRAAIDFDPYSPALHGLLAWALHLSGDTHGAVEQAKRAQKLFPDHSLAIFFCSIVFAAAAKPGDTSGEYPTRAIALATRLIQICPSLDAGYATLAYAQARQGRIIEARALIDRQHWLNRERLVMHSFYASALVELGEIDAAIECLVSADEQHCPWLFELLVDPRLQALHPEPAFQRLCRVSRQSESDASVA